MILHPGLQPGEKKKARPLDAGALKQLFRSVLCPGCQGRKFQPDGDLYFLPFSIPVSVEELGNVEADIFLSMNWALFSMPFFGPSIRSYWLPM